MTTTIPCQLAVYRPGPDSDRPTLAFYTNARMSEQRVDVPCIEAYEPLGLDPALEAMIAEFSNVPQVSGFLALTHMLLIYGSLHDQWSPAVQERLATSVMRRLGLPEHDTDIIRVDSMDEGYKWLMAKTRA